MMKGDLIKKLQTSIPHYPHADLAHAVRIIFAAMTASLINNEIVKREEGGAFL